MTGVRAGSGGTGILDGTRAATGRGSFVPPLPGLFTWDAGSPSEQGEDLFVGGDGPDSMIGDQG